MLAQVILEARFLRDSKGRYFTDSVFTSHFWERYLEVFSRVRVLARVADANHIPPGYQPACGPNVEFYALPYYQGPVQYLWERSALKRAMRTSISDKGSVILRIPSQLSWLAAQVLQERKQPYAVEVVGDPYDTFSPGATSGPLRPFFRRLFVHTTTVMCRNAVGSAYVTSNALQNRYPPGPAAISTNYSSIDLLPQAIRSAPRTFSAPVLSPRLITVGTLEQLYKGQDILIRAIQPLIRSGLNISLRIVGDGSFRPQLVALARNLGVSGAVEFLGRVEAGAKVRELLDAADFFVLPSRQEGLPRALIEAMARGLPCIATDVGGIPELLQADALVRPNDVNGLARVLKAFSEAPSRMNAHAKHNLHTAQAYEATNLSVRRRDFYLSVAEYSNLWPGS